MSLVNKIAKKDDEEQFRKEYDEILDEANTKSRLLADEWNKKLGGKPLLDGPKEYVDAERLIDKEAWKK